MLHYFTLILVCQLAGELLSTALSLPVPGPVIGMVLLFLFLVFRGRIAAPLEGVADALHVRPKTVRRWRGLGLLNGVQVGKRVWFSEAAIEAFLKAKEGNEAHR